MVRFTENSIIIEIHTGKNPAEQLNYFQTNIIKALRHLDENMSADEYTTINYYLGDILENMLIDAQQLELLEKSLNDKNANQQLKSKMYGKLVDAE